jgi:hypothetical protein
MDGTRAISLVCLMVASCGDSDSSAANDGARVAGSCPPPNNIVAIDLGCSSSEGTAARTTGPCTVTSAEDSKTINLQTSDAGTCHVELSFASGDTASVDVDIVSKWRPRGDDPHGCGQEFVAVTDTGAPCLSSACKVLLPELACDAGQ